MRHAIEGLSLTGAAEEESPRSAASSAPPAHAVDADVQAQASVVESIAAGDGDSATPESSTSEAKPANSETSASLQHATEALAAQSHVESTQQEQSDKESMPVDSSGDSKPVIDQTSAEADGDAATDADGQPANSKTDDAAPRTNGHAPILPAAAHVNGHSSGKKHRKKAGKR